MAQQPSRGGGIGGAPDSPAPGWKETRRNGVFLGAVRDFRGARAAAFWVPGDQRVIYLDLAVEKSTRGDEFIPAPRVAKLPGPLKPGTAGQIIFFAIATGETRALRAPAAPWGGTFLGFETSADRAAPAVMQAMDAAAMGLLAAALPPALEAPAFTAAFARATPEAAGSALHALLFARGKPLIKQALGARPNVFEQAAEPAWQAQAFAQGVASLAALTPTDQDELGLLAGAARAWGSQASADAGTRAAQAAVGREFVGWPLGPRDKVSPGIESRVEPRLGPFDRDAIAWWDLLSEVEPRFARQVLPQLREVTGETAVWIEEADARAGKIAGWKRGAWRLEPGVRIPAGVAFGSQVSVVSRPVGARGTDAEQRVLALKLEKNDPEGLAGLILQEADGRTIGVLARRRAQGQPGLPADWPARAGNVADFSQLAALKECRDRVFVEELERLLPRSLKEAHHRSDTESIRQPIVVALGWIAAGATDRARKLLQETPELIRVHGVPYSSDGKLSSYQQSLITAGLWLVEKIEQTKAKRDPFPDYAGSEFSAWLKEIDPALPRLLR